MRLEDFAYSEQCPDFYGDSKQDKENYCPICDGDAQEIVVDDEIKTICENCGEVQLWDEG